MTVFLFIVALMLMAGLTLVLWPLWHGAGAAGSRREANIAAYRQNTAEIEREVAAGRVSRADADAHKEEMGARLLEDVDDATANTGEQSSSGKPWLVTSVVVVAFLLLSLGMYGLLGDPRGLDSQSKPDMAAIVEKMQERLDAVPDDLRTRSLLAEVQLTQHHYAKAAETLKGLNDRLDKPRVPLLLTEARARVLANDGTVTDRASTLYEQVLKLDPDNTEALWFGGISALSAGNQKRAMQRWEKLLAKPDLDSGFKAKVKRRLAELRGVAPTLQRNNANRGN